jgi:hypothetical protein
MKFSVSLVSEGDREITLEETVELADAVAPFEGIASGIGTMSYGVQILVDAENSADAVEEGRKIFEAAIKATNLPFWPVTNAHAMSEDDDYVDLEMIIE